jgi:hypothetical protein
MPTHRCIHALKQNLEVVNFKKFPPRVCDTNPPRLEIVQSITTLRNKVGRGESNLFGGVFIARADDNSIKEVPDLKGGIVSASSILLMGSGQTQWQEMRKHGLDLLVDPSQVIDPTVMYIFLLYPSHSIYSPVLACLSRLSLLHLPPLPSNDMHTGNIRRLRPIQDRRGRPRRPRGCRVRK